MYRWHNSFSPHIPLLRPITRLSDLSSIAAAHRLAGWLSGWCWNNAPGAVQRSVANTDWSHRSWVLSVPDRPHSATSYLLWCRLILARIVLMKRWKLIFKINCWLDFWRAATPGWRAAEVVLRNARCRECSVCLAFGLTLRCSILRLCFILYLTGFNTPHLHTH